MRVVLNLPDKHWAALVDIADKQAVKVNELIARTILTLIPREIPARDRIPGLVKAGLPDAVIAERLNVRKAFVAEVRRAYGMPPNRFDRAAWDDEFKTHREGTE
jgi:hypothetical protein